MCQKQTRGQQASYPGVGWWGWGCSTVAKCSPIQQKSFLHLGIHLPEPMEGHDAVRTISRFRWSAVGGDGQDVLGLGSDISLNRPQVGGQGVLPWPDHTANQSVSQLVQISGGRPRGFALTRSHCKPISQSVSQLVIGILHHVHVGWLMLRCPGAWKRVM